jgi:g-D-glutamyl-meso-diaminopimelate peptidase
MQKMMLICLVSLFLCPTIIEAQSIIEGDRIYSFDEMEKDLFLLKERFPIELQSIGKSEKGRDLWAARLGKGEKSLLLVGTHHGREWMTTSLLMKMLEKYAIAYKQGEKLGSYSPQLLDEVSIWFVPMINPDGVSIQQGNLSRLSFTEKIAIWQMNTYSFNWIRWKANAKGVDLNRQYPAGWNTVTAEVEKPSYQFYKGRRPFEAKEVQALSSFTQNIKPLIAVSYHTSGREIFWYYQNKRKHVIRDYMLAKKTAQLTRYKLSMPENHAMGSGFTDWFITEFERPAMTIELSYLVDETEPPLSVFPEEWQRNQFVGIMLVNEAIKIE